MIYPWSGVDETRLILEYIKKGKNKSGEHSLPPDSELVGKHHQSRSVNQYEYIKTGDLNVSLYLLNLVEAVLNLACLPLLRSEKGEVSFQHCDLLIMLLEATVDDGGMLCEPWSRHLT